MTLEQYRDKFLALPLSELRVIECRNFGALVASVVHREGLFQTELVMGFPNQSVPAHRHPNIEAIERHISGDLRICVGSTPEEADLALERACLIPERYARGKSFPIPSTCWHAAKTGPKGATFWSFQQWSGKVPQTCAGIDWEGDEKISCE